MTTEAETRVMWSPARGCLEPPATGRGRKPPPLEAPAPATPWFQTSGLQNREMINFCILKLPSTSPISGALLQQLQEANKLGKPGSPCPHQRPNAQRCGRPADSHPTRGDVGPPCPGARPIGGTSDSPSCPGSENAGSAAELARTIHSALTSHLSA